MASKRNELPESVRKLISPKATLQEVKQAEALYQQGLKEGSMIGYGEILSVLEGKYMTGENRPERGSPEAEAILSLAQELGNMLREKIGSNGNQG